MPKGPIGPQETWWNIRIEQDKRRITVLTDFHFEFLLERKTIDALIRSPRSWSN